MPQRGTTAIAGATAATYAVQAADVGQALRVIVSATNSAGSAQAASAATAPVTAAPVATAAALVVSGTYSGTMTAATVVWEQNGNAVGAPVAITSFSDGTWTATITAPGTAGVYRLRATFSGSGPTATTDDVTIGTPDAMNLATFTFDGSGDGADTVVVFGHSFPQGALSPTTPIVLRRADNNAALRTQMTPLATWPDGTVRTAAFAGELPALANGALLQVRLRRDEAHPSPGPALTWAGALSGRSIRIRTWAPGNTTTPLWTYDVGAALGSSTDDWMTGPLAIQRRVQTIVPASATQNNTSSGNGPDVLRLHVDVTATKDGMILVDWAWNNAAMHQAGGKVARFGYTVEVDGTIIYDQRPSSGAARDLLQYCWWMNRRGKRGATIYDFHTTFRPLFRPDYQVLVDSKFLLPYTRQAELMNTSSGAARMAENRTNGATQLTNPYWSWGLTRDAGTPGGREEIGYKTLAQYVWAVTQGSRWAEFSAHWQAQAFAAASWITWDHAENRTAHSDQWRRLLLEQNGGGQAVTTRELATQHPTGQVRTRNATDHLTADQAHRGAFYGLTAVLSGRRLCYDLLAARAAEASMQVSRWNGVSLFSYMAGPDWRNTVPDLATGLSWAPMPWTQQTRSTGWQLRDIVEADYALPDNMPRRTYYTQNVQAWINGFNGARSVIQSYMGNHDNFGWFAVHADDNWKINLYMFAFWSYGLATMVRLGYEGAQTLFQGVAKSRSGAILHSDKLARWNITGTDQWMFDLDSGTGFARPPFANWAAVDAHPINGTFLADWTKARNAPYPALGYPDGSDYYLNQLNTQALQAKYVTDPAQRAASLDALVRYRSERQFNRGGDGIHPQVSPAAFRNAGQPMTNLVMVEGWDWRTNVAPTLLTPGTMTVAGSVAAGSIIGFVNWTGPVPRCTTANNANHDAFEIVSQPAGSPFTISRGGVIRRNGTGTLTAGQTTLRVRARVVEGDAPLGESEVTRWSNTVTVTVNVT